jgi:transposase
MSKLSTDLSSVTVVGLDLAKHVFQVHCIDAAGRAVLNRSIRRRELIDFFKCLPPCRIGMEACGSAHHWGSELAALGHDV